MPTISRFYGIVIAMFFDDHGYPHFHARHAGTEAKVRLDQIEVIESTPEVRHLRLVLAGRNCIVRSCWRTGGWLVLVRH